MYYLDKIKTHLSNWWEYIKEHFVRIIVISFILSLFCLAFYFFPKENIIENGVITEQHIIIFGITLENWFTYISMIALLITAIWAIYQFDKNNSRKQHEKGAEISKIISNDLLYKCSILGEVIIRSELDNLFHFDNLKPSIFKNFDKTELVNLFDNQDEIFIEIKSICTSNEIQQIYFRCLETNITQQNYKDLLDKVYSDEDAEKLFKLDNACMPFNFLGLVTSTLNDLEYISMFISSQSAGSKYIYQSLHQFFIRTIKILAPLICIQNKDYSDKYYTNIIHVYNTWCLMRKKDLKKEQKNKEKINKILNPKIKTI